MLLQYIVELEKQGFKFELVEETNKDNILQLKYKALQLSTIQIQVSDINTTEPI